MGAGRCSRPAWVYTFIVGLCFALWCGVGSWRRLASLVRCSIRGGVPIQGGGFRGVHPFRRCAIVSVWRGCNPLNSGFHIGMRVAEGGLPLNIWRYKFWRNFRSLNIWRYHFGKNFGSCGIFFLQNFFRNFLGGEKFVTCGGFRVNCYAEGNEIHPGEGREDTQGVE